MAAKPDYIQPLRLEGGGVGCLMIHGFTSSPADLRPLSKYLHSLGYTVWELLLPGHGACPANLAQCGWQDWLRAVELELEKLKARGSQVWVLGFSMGGILAMLAAAHGGADGLVTIAAPIWPRPWQTRWAFVLRHFRRYVQLGTPRRYCQPSWRYEEVALASIAQLMQLIKRGKKALGAVTVPALMVQGCQDRTIRPQSAGYIYKRLGSRRKELIVVPGEHMLLLGDQGPELCRRIGDFIMETGGDADVRDKAGPRN